MYPLHDHVSSSNHSGNISVKMIPGRHGQKLYGYLVDSIRDLGISKKHYDLSVTLTEKEIPYALADDGNAQRLKVIFTAKVILKDSKGNIALDTDVRTSATKNIASSQGNVLLSMYNVVNDSVIKDLAFRIVENISVAIKN